MKRKKVHSKQKQNWKILDVSFCVLKYQYSLRDCFRESQYPKVCNANNSNIAVVRCVEKISDLSLGLPEIERSAYLDSQTLASLKCAMEENCVSRDAYQIVLTQPMALRKLLRFTTKAENVGSADFSPYANYDQWEWHQCHMHYHSMESFASFDIYNMQYQKMAQGHKASFCLMDTVCKTGITPKYTCGNKTQGRLWNNICEVFKKIFIQNIIIFFLF